MPSIDPLKAAAELAALALLKARPDPESLYGEANRPSSFSIHPAVEEKLVFDAFQRALMAVMGRRVNHAETIRWILACALRHHGEILDEARRSGESAS